jgi:hypothetical protein
MKTKITELREQVDKVSKGLVGLDTSKPGALEEMRNLNAETVRIFHNFLCLLDAAIDYALVHRDSRL